MMNKKDDIGKERRRQPTVIVSMKSNLKMSKILEDIGSIIENSGSQNQHKPDFEKQFPYKARLVGKRTSSCKTTRFQEDLVGPQNRSTGM